MALNINGTTGISGVEGSVSAPVLTGTDSNCGISFPAADTIKFSTGGVERMQITNSGVSGTGVGGKIKQFKYAQSSTSVETTSSTYQNLSATFSVAITPTSASNLLVARFTFQGTVYETSGADASGLVALTDDDASSYLYEQSIRTFDYGYNGSFMQNPLCIEHVKVAGNTNARTYSIRYRLISGDKILINNYAAAAGTTNSVLSVMEIEP